MTVLGLPARAQPLPAALFAAALFASAALIFMLQPMFARMVTPLLGGSPAVWNTAMVFFQAALLLGYFYAHALARLRSLAAQAAIHGAMLALAALALPVWPTQMLGEPDVAQPALWLLGVLALSVGAPYAVASATAPLLQAWYARSGRADAHDPYHLYVASNLGSILGLLAYPFAVEPGFGLAAQSVLWSAAYGLTALLVMASAASVIAGGAAPLPAAPVAGAAAAVAWRQRLYWLAAAAVPSSLLLGVTQHIVTDIASAPFVWVPPLVLYLLTFVIAFRKGAGREDPALLVLHGFGLALLGAGLKGHVGLDLLQHLGVFFVAALVCHGALARSRPDAARLTEFYVFVSLGGVLGGAATALLAPAVFDAVLEYPIALAATALFRPAGAPRLKMLADLLLGAAAIVLVLTALDIVALSRLSLLLVAVALVANRERRFVIAALALAALSWPSFFAGDGATVARERTFFGVHRVLEVDTPDGRMRLLAHGTTVHGAQFVDPARARETLTYYAPGTALHDSIRAGLPEGRSARVAVIGLGAGATACVLRPGDAAVFYEIDPHVAALAADPRMFGYLAACGGHRVVLGDGRIKLAAEADGGFDLVLVDAFSSDAIPTHLLTREAVRLYMRKLAPDGVLLLHVSNRNLAIPNEALRVAAAEGLAARVLHTPERDPQNRYLGTAASTVLAARDPARLAALDAQDARWRAAPALPGAAWSDDYVDLLRPLLERPVDRP